MCSDTIDASLIGLFPLRARHAHPSEFSSMPCKQAKCVKNKEQTSPTVIYRGQSEPIDAGTCIMSKQRRE